MRDLPQWEFDFYALSLARGHGFGEDPPIKAWATTDNLAWGVITENVSDKSFGYVVMRRRVDSVWVVTEEARNIQMMSEARTQMDRALKEGQAPEPMPPGIVMRPALYDLAGREPSDMLKMLARQSHQPGAWALNQLYLALPRPDRNWTSDFQTANFHTRLWEALLVGCFREQGVKVAQPFEAPDFHIQNRLGGEAWVEAVTANPSIPYNHFNAPMEAMPTESGQVFFGPAAVRFAKTLGNKLDRKYHLLPHVDGKPFIIAIADFQAPGSMMWSREGLIGYLYGEGAQVVEINGVLQAASTSVSNLLGPSSFPAGLFRDDRHAELSAVIFSNACSIAKFNRVAISAGGAPADLRYTRVGNFFDRTPGALKGIPFCMDITSSEYRELWPHGYEPWSAELEVFHNPFARHPMALDLLPEATHWFDQDGELVCRSMYEASILWSQTLIQSSEQPPLTLEDILTPSNRYED